VWHRSGVKGGFRFPKFLFLVIASMRSLIRSSLAAPALLAMPKLMLIKFHATSKKEILAR
jgi:hypothetical protein